MLDSPLRSEINAAIKRGDAELAELGIPTDPATQGVGVGFGLVNGEAVEIIARDTLNKTAQGIQSDMNNAAQQHATNAVELLRSLSSSTITDASRGGAEANVNRAIARGLITGNPTIADRAIRELFAENSAEAQRVRKLGNKHIAPPYPPTIWIRSSRTSRCDRWAAPSSAPARTSAARRTAS